MSVLRNRYTASLSGAEPHRNFPCGVIRRNRANTVLKTPGSRRPLNDSAYQHRGFSGFVAWHVHTYSAAGEPFEAGEPLGPARGDEITPGPTPIQLSYILFWAPQAFLLGVRSIRALIPQLAVPVCPCSCPQVVDIPRSQTMGEGWRQESELTSEAAAGLKGSN